MVAENKNSVAKKIEGLSPRKGIVLEDKKIAAYMDEHGKLHTYSAVCTHLGCTVKVNPLEESFDCPCHGSRFSGLTGRVINGPANKPLESKKSP
jgi:Rieske Fe-S protein